MADTNDIQSQLMGMLGGNKAPALLSMTPQMAMLQDMQSGDQQAMNMAALPAGRGAVAVMGMLGNRIGSGLADAMGLQSPMVQMANQMNQFKNNIAGIDNSNAPSVTPLDNSGTLNVRDSASLAGHYQRMALLAQNAAQKAGLPPEIGQFYYKDYMQKAQDVLKNNKAILDNNTAGTKPIDMEKLTPASATALQASMQKTNNFDYNQMVLDPEQKGSVYDRAMARVTNYNTILAKGDKLSTEQQNDYNVTRNFLAHVDMHDGQVAVNAPEPVNAAGLPITPVKANTDPNSAEPSHPMANVNVTPTTKPQAYTNEQIEKYSTAVEHAGLPQYKAALQNVDKVLKPYLGDLASGKISDIPGLSKKDQTLWAYGHFNKLSAEARNVIEALQGAHNIYLTTTDGKRVNAGEQAGANIAMGKGSLLSTLDALHGIRLMHDSYSRMEANLSAGIPQAAKDQYWQRYNGGGSNNSVPAASAIRSVGSLQRGKDGTLTYVRGQ